MTNTLVINGKKLHPIKDAVASVSYSRDYVTRLAREQKITASNIGRQWFVDLESLKSYAEASKLELDIRKKQLSEERRKELEIREAVESKKARLSGLERSLHAKALSTATLVLCFGLMTGLTIDYLFGFAQPANFQVASTPTFYNNKNVVTLSDGTADTISSNLNYTDTSITNVVSFSPVLEKLPVSGQGVLLLPDTDASSTTPADFFSDEVKVETLMTGEQVVVMIDKNGNKISNNIPFVVVPLEEANQVYEN